MSRLEGGVLGLVAVVLLAWQVPLANRKAAGLDEDFYAVPGVAILDHGVPQIPYIPSRDPQSIFFHADELLLTLPPLGFYLEAPVQAVLGRSLGAARLASLLTGLASLVAVWALGWFWSGQRRVALAGAVFYAGSRPFLFPATTARPDMAAVTCGLFALLAGTLWRRRGSTRWAVLAGACAGLAMLAHPVGAVPATQTGLLVLASPGSWKLRLRAAALYSLVALAVFGLWLPLIALRPELFRIQFGGNVLGRAGPGLARTLLDPGPVIAFQLREILEHIEWLQTAVFAAGLAACLIGLVRGNAAARTLFVQAALGTLLLAVFMGQHVIRGYYAYPAALASLCVGALLSWLSRIPEFIVPGRPAWWRPAGVALVAAALALSLVPGAGLRVAAAHLTHWRDPAYDARALVRQMLDAVPPDALVAVEGPYVFEWYRAGRPVVKAIVHPFYFDVRATPFRYVVFGPMGLKQTKPRLQGLVLRRTFGNPTAPFACYAELYEVIPVTGEAAP